ncbi:hypothetical protein GCM10023323_69660 [Streptomyces thinghirensis]|uniref:Uncharacterized protein n=1 Tax=Streptomyces thinghirensis TaxID=551547 RepID=A0ABP9TCV1_9ACTN
MDLLPQSSGRPALAADERGGGDEGDEKDPEQWVPYVFRHKTLFRRLKAGLLDSRLRGRPGGLPAPGLLSGLSLKSGMRLFTHPPAPQTR